MIQRLEDAYYNESNPNNSSNKNQSNAPTNNPSPPPTPASKVNPNSNNANTSSTSNNNRLSTFDVTDEINDEDDWEFIEEWNVIYPCMYTLNKIVTM